MANSVTFRRDYYTLFSSFWCLGCWMAILTFSARNLFPSLSTVIFNFMIAFTFLLFLLSILALLFERRRIITISQTGLHFFTANPFSDNTLFLEWKHIKKAEIANRESLNIVFSHNFFSSARLNRDTLVISLNSPLDPEREERFRRITSKLLSSDQLMSKDDKTEIWVTHPPRYGFNAVLKELSKYTQTPKPLDNSKQVTKTLIQDFLTHVILWPGVLIYLYFINR